MQAGFELAMEPGLALNLGRSSCLSSCALGLHVCTTNAWLKVSLFYTRELSIEMTEPQHTDILHTVLNS